MITHDDLARALLAAVRSLDFGATADAMRGGQPIAQLPSIDLAVAAFPPDQAPVWANVLLSRDHPSGLVAVIDAQGGPVSNVHFLADQRDAQHHSVAWWPEADWSTMDWHTLHGAGPNRFVAPYPASLLKVMVALGVAMAVDEERVSWPERALQAMITLSDNDATTEMVALLHRLGFLGRLQDRLLACGLTTLRLQGTTADGGWGNAAGAGVGMIQMTAWDSARLMWLLDADAPAAPWLARGAALVSPASRRRLRQWLQAQQLNEILSSQSLRGLPGWVPGLPDEVSFAHKTGTTENYASDAGIVQGRAPRRRHYVIALLSNLGRRYAPHPACATTWRLPALAAAIDGWLAARLEAPSR